MTNDSAAGFFPTADMFTRAWSDFASKMMGAGLAFTPDSTPPDAARQMRSAMFQAWSDYFDQFMRSAEFLDMMKQSLTAATQMRRQMNDFLGQVQHDFQGASRQDLDQVIASLRNLERHVTDSTEQISAHLEKLSRRLDKLERTLQSDGDRSAARRESIEANR
jgi:hypothetical protein